MYTSFSLPCPIVSMLQPSVPENALLVHMETDRLCSDDMQEMSGETLSNFPHQNRGHGQPRVEQDVASRVSIIMTAQFQKPMPAYVQDIK